MSLQRRALVSAAIFSCLAHCQTPRGQPASEIESASRECFTDCEEPTERWIFPIRDVNGDGAEDVVLVERGIEKYNSNTNSPVAMTRCSYKRVDVHLAEPGRRRLHAPKDFDWLVGHDCIPNLDNPLGVTSGLLDIPDADRFLDAFTAHYRSWFSSPILCHADPQRFRTFLTDQVVEAHGKRAVIVAFVYLTKSWELPPNPNVAEPERPPTTIGALAMLDDCRVVRLSEMKWVVDDVAIDPAPFLDGGARNPLQGPQIDEARRILHSSEHLAAYEAITACSRDADPLACMTGFIDAPSRDPVVTKWQHALRMVERTAPRRLDQCLARLMMIHRKKVSRPNSDSPVTPTKLPVSKPTAE